MYENSICDPLVSASSSRKNETSCGASPGEACDSGRILEIRMHRPVSVEITSRSINLLWPVNCSAGCCVVAMSV